MRRVYALILALLLLFMAGCGGNTAGKDTSEHERSEESRETPESEEEEETAEDPGLEIYESIMAAERIEVNDAYDQLKDVDSEDTQVLEFLDDLKELRDCQGLFLQPKDTSTQYTSKQYTADVLFYLMEGTLYCHVDYNNYMGDLGDGTVQSTDEKDYLFESFPTGEFGGGEQEFQIYFSPTQLHIMWAESCDYTLYRGDGSEDEVERQQFRFEDSTAYSVVERHTSEVFSEDGYEITYNEETETVNIYAGTPGGVGGVRALLITGHQQGIETWSEIRTTLVEWNGLMLEMASMMGHVEHLNLYMVDPFEEGAVYEEDDYMLCIEDGVLVYDYGDTVGTGSGTTGGSGSYGSYGSYGGGTASATMGERDALDSAKSYLRVMAFSYEGLIDQLEYEGYSHSEAVYGADHCGADWYEQAAKSAAEYLDVMPFSRQELIDQLEYEGFTHAQAVYGVEQNGY